MRDCPDIATRGKEGNKVSPSVPKDDVQATRCFYALRTRGEKSYGDYDEGKSLNFLFSAMSSFYVGEYG